MTIPISVEELMIGREPANNMMINDPLVSRHHCSIGTSEGQVRITDLESLNGTFVNDVPTREKTLEHGDRIKVGESQFVFLVEEDEHSAAIPLVDSTDEHFITAVTVKLDQDEAVYLQPDKIAQTISPGGRMARDLAALLRISTAISGIRNLEEL